MPYGLMLLQLGGVMPEGLMIAGMVTGAVHDDPDHEPQPTPDAPRGWTWNRKARKWAPRQRGPVLWNEGTGAPGQPAAGDGARGGPGRDSDPAAARPDALHDPEPSWLGSDDAPGDDGKLKFADVPKQVKDDIAGFAGLVGTPILAMLQQADPYCGTILAQSYEGIVDATLPLICRSSKIVRYFSGEQTDWMLWGKLAIALKEVARAFVQHHVLRTVDVVRDEHGQAHVVPRAREEPQHGDHLTPPAPYNYAA